ncbi:putative outermembrane protein [hydrothermal vent metagenome]|uniref:Putative outermembrane protein n=1 Tax=hydrothermal vent metagenome TaxID=652676 RepID=A0A3B0QYM2_9ZZZZ
MNYPFIKSIPFIFSLLFALQLSAQNTVLKKYTSSNKGKFFISWGGNRESYSKSDITFKGNDYRFTIKDVSAHDKPKGWHIDYINPTRITIPQTNIKLGYFISDHYSVSIGVDHMKYVMNRNKTKTLDGFINLPDNEAGSVYNGVYNNESFFVSEEFLKFEHTNGLNYIYSEFARYDDISSIFNIHNTDKIQINITEGVAAGVLYPKSNTTLLSKDRYDEFHLAGYGLSANVGLNFTFCKHFFIQTDLKGGYINMNDIRTTSDASESASQHFWFLQRVVSLGGIFRI